ncbi:hypothetical protein C5167_027479 [Papaver somniferum]|uniref:protein ENHANCED PSEUDOMONAS SUSCEPTIBILTY 1-like n=1 Tax=Papaver somniferum TaxID=3469 RepID=UPI000E704525|nr:protein ENHANCED PSEUDOMONAS SUSCEPTIBILTY 1-like [Papaver somniferum]RZC91414.1 hypothetical protein C5167_027479 [Papaver somniferum]
MSSPEVHHVSTTMVRPASCIDEPTGNHRRIDLSPGDLVFLRIAYMQKGLLYSNDEKCINEKISNLKTSLSHTLDHFLPLAGRLAIEKHEDDNTISVYIDCNSEGVEFIHATSDISVEDIVSPTYVPQSLIDQLFTLTGVRNYQGQSHPLFSVQVTELRDGAIFIGCSANHSVCDGTSFWHFINSWSAIARSAENHASSPPPVFERWFIKDTDRPIHLPFSFADKLSAAVRDTTTTEVSPLEGLVERCFHFTKANIAALKARANSEIISETKQNMVISSLQALLAHVWTAVIRCRSSLNDNYDDSRVLVVLILMNNRTKLIPPLPETYFGNSLVGGLVTLKEGELIKKGSGVLASLLKEMVNSNNFEKSRSFIESWIEKPIMPGPAGDGPEIYSNMLVARSSQWFNMYGNDFGWGRPIAVKTGRNGKNYGVTTVSPGPVEGSVDIEICLPVEVLKAMENDAEFMEAFSS